ncbi:MAG: winged helix-turn-helix domain-containing protein [Planctomycetaceae bacterium]
MATKKTAARKTASTKAKAEPKKLSQMAAAEKVLATAKEPMNCKAIVEAMAKKKLWSSPAGKTPEATLYAALLRHTRDKGTEARFAKAGPGLFTINRK